MEKIQKFTDLIVWQEGHKLVLSIYSLTKDLPKAEVYGLVSQIQRSAVSITSNIAEGFGRRGQKEKIQFYYIAHGSLTETENLIFVIRDAKLIEKEICDRLFDQIHKVQGLLNGLIKSIRY